MASGALLKSTMSMKRGGRIARDVVHLRRDVPGAPARAVPGEEIRAIHAREQVSQPVFAAYLTVSRNLVADWGAA